MKKCFVTGCINKNTLDPELKFFTVPHTKERLQWFSVVGKSIEHVNFKSTYYCCEKHIQVREF